MITPELVAYVRVEMTKGTDRSKLEKTLLDTGWSAPDVAEAFNVVNGVVPASAPAAPVLAAYTPEPLHETSGFTIQPARRSHLGLMLAVLLFLVIGAGAGYAYYAGYLPLNSPSVGSVINNMTSATSLKYDATLSIKINFKEPLKVADEFLPGLDVNNIILKFRGGTESKDENEKSYMDASLSMGTVRVGGEMRLLNENLYVTLKEAPKIGMGIEDLMNKWFTFDLGEDLAKSTAPLENLGLEVPSVPEITEEQELRFETITKNASFIIMTGKNGSETVEGVATNRYLFTLDTVGIGAYLTELKSFITSVPALEGVGENLDVEEFKKKIAKINSFQGEIWLGKKDHLPHKLIIIYNEDIGEGAEDLGTIDATFILLLSDWNVPITVEAPVGSQKFMDFLSASLGDARSKGADASVKVNVRNSRAWAEIYYDNNWYGGKEGYQGFCGSTKFKGVLKAIKDSPTPFTLSCKDSKASFAVFAPLSTGAIFCTDNQGIKELNKDPVGTYCK